MKLIHTIFLIAYLCIIAYCYTSGAWHLMTSIVFVVLIHIGFCIAKMQEDNGM